MIKKPLSSQDAQQTVKMMPRVYRKARPLPRDRPKIRLPAILLPQMPEIRQTAKARPEPVHLPIITVPPEHLRPPHHPPTAPKPLWKARRAAQTQKS